MTDTRLPIPSLRRALPAALVARIRPAVRRYCRARPPGGHCRPRGENPRRAASLSRVPGQAGGAAVSRLCRGMRFAPGFRGGPELLPPASHGKPAFLAARLKPMFEEEARQRQVAGLRRGNDFPVGQNSAQRGNAAESGRAAQKVADLMRVRQQDADAISNTKARKPKPLNP